MKQFEYSAVLFDGDGNKKFTDTLENAGKNGWELCSVTSGLVNNSAQVIFIFKREMESPEETLKNLVDKGILEKQKRHKASCDLNDSRVSARGWGCTCAPETAYILKK